MGKSSPERWFSQLIRWIATLLAAEQTSSSLGNNACHLQTRTFVPSLYTGDKQAEPLAILPDPQASLVPTGLSGKRFVSGISVKINFVNSHI